MVITLVPLISDGSDGNPTFEIVCFCGTYPTCNGDYSGTIDITDLNCSSCGATCTINVTVPSGSSTISPSTYATSPFLCGLGKDGKTFTGSFQFCNYGPDSATYTMQVIPSLTQPTLPS